MELKQKIIERKHQVDTGKLTSFSNKNMTLETFPPELKYFIPIGSIHRLKERKEDEIMHIKPDLKEKTEQ